MCNKNNSVFTGGQRCCYVSGIVLTILGAVLLGIGIGFPFLVDYFIRVQLDISSPSAKVRLPGSLRVEICRVLPCANPLSGLRVLGKQSSS